MSKVQNEVVSRVEMKLHGEEVTEKSATHD